MIVALTRFQALCGFRPARQCAELLELLDVPELGPYAAALRARPGDAALRQVFTAFLTPPPGLLTSVTEAVRRARTDGGPYGASLAAYAAITHAHPDDPGLLPALMLNHAELEPGQALFLGAGIAHAYLSGLGVEIMASSDNVLRCGLTSKHVDAAELLGIVRFTELPVRALAARPDPATGEHVYPAPVDDFRLSRFDLVRTDPPRTLTADAPQILLCVHGEATVASEERVVELRPGRAVYAPAGDALRLSGEGTVFRATSAVRTRPRQGADRSARAGASRSGDTQPPVGPSAGANGSVVVPRAVFQPQGSAGAGALAEGHRA